MIKNFGAAEVASWWDQWGGTALLGALIKWLDHNVLRELIAAGVDVTLVTTGGDTALHCVKTAKAVRVLTTAGASLSVQNKEGWNPLHLACGSGRVEVVRAMASLVSFSQRIETGRRQGTSRLFVGHEELLPVLDTAM